MVKFIESELILLKKEVDEMWTLVYNQLDRAGEAVMTLDKELAQQVMVRERRVNAFELKIDSDIEDIIALYNPVAIDLRFVLAMLKINTNLERLGDFAEGIARFVIRCKEPVLDADLLTRLRLGEMQAEVLSMLELAKRALNEENIEMDNGGIRQKIICWMISMRKPQASWQITSANIRRRRIHVLTWLVCSANWSVRATILLI